MLNVKFNLVGVAKDLLPKGLPVYFSALYLCGTGGRLRSYGRLGVEEHGGDDLGGVHSHPGGGGGGEGDEKMIVIVPITVDCAFHDCLSPS